MLRILPLQITIDQDTAHFVLDLFHFCMGPIYSETEVVNIIESEMMNMNIEGAGADDFEACDSSKEEEEEQQQDQTETQKEEQLPEEEELQQPEGTAKINEELLSPHFGSTDEEPNQNSSNDFTFSEFSVSPLLVSVDYRAKRLDVQKLKAGELWELLNLLPLLEGLEVAFRRVRLKNVTLTEILPALLNHVQEDLNRSQILRCIAGVTPIRSLANIGQGVTDLVRHPLRQARRVDGRVSRGIVSGLTSFLRHLTVESINLTERVLVGTQTVMGHLDTIIDPEQAAQDQMEQQMYGRMVQQRFETDFASPGNDPEIDDEWQEVEQGTQGFYQPENTAEGLSLAAASLHRGIRRAGQALVSRPIMEYQRGATSTRVATSVVRGIPVCILRPAIGATEAITTTLRGVRNQVDHEHKQQIESKFKGPQV